MQFAITLKTSGWYIHLDIAMPLKCMLIDDSLFIRQTVTSMIEEGGHKMVETFEDGPSFLNSMNAIATPDIIFCDIILPEMTGLDLLDIITEGFPNTKIIMMSGVSHAEAISAALRLGAIDFLQKPVDKDQLLSILEKIEDSAKLPSVEELSTIGVATTLLTGFLNELTAHSSSTLRKIVVQQTRSILTDIKKRGEGMLNIDVNKVEIEPDPDLWGTYSEEEVLSLLSDIPQELNFELQFLYSEDFVDNLYNQSIMTMASKKRFSNLFENVEPARIGLPPLPEFSGELQDSLTTKAGTTYDQLDNSISMCLFVFGDSGPEISTRVNTELLGEEDLMRNSVFYYTLVDEDNFQEGLFGPMPVTSEKNSNLSALTYTMKKPVNETDKKHVIILSIYYTPAAERIVADYNRLSFIIRTRLVPVDYISDIDKNVMNGLLDDIIDYILED